MKILRILGMLVLWFCLGTIISQALVATYLVWRWQIDLARLQEILRVARGLGPSPQPAPAGDTDLLRDELAYDDFLARRAEKARDLELKELQLQAAQEMLQAELSKLVAEKAKLAQERQEFENRVTAVQDQAREAARETLRGILESLRPDQAKAQLQAMTARGQWDEAVALLTAMPASRRSRILGEFKSPQDQQVLGELLRRIGQTGGVNGQATSDGGLPPETSGR